MFFCDSQLWRIIKLILTYFFYYYFFFFGGGNPRKSTLYDSTHFGRLVRAGLEPATPSTEKQAMLSCYP